MGKDSLSADQHRYAGFWRRLGAFGVDFLISGLPLLPIAMWGSSRFKYFPLYSLGPVAIWSLFYNVYLVRRFGGTPGKLAMRTEIRNLDGSAVGLWSGPVEISAGVSVVASRSDRTGDAPF